MEAQVEAQEVETKKAPSPPLQRGQKTPEQIRREGERKDLQLSRVRIQNDLQTATNPNHRKSLEAALEHLDKKIAELN